MAVLRRLDGHCVSLGPRAIVGRELDSQLRLSDGTVGGKHALISYDPFRKWEILDLASKNGTYVDGVPLSHPAVPLREKVFLRFGGSPDVWEVIDLSPPGPAAYCQETGQLRAGTSELILPDDAVRATRIAWDGSAWQLVFLTSGEHQMVQDQEEIQIEDQSWQLLLPDAMESDTYRVRRLVPEEGLKLTLTVSSAPDVTVLEVGLASGGQMVSLSVQKHTALLLALVQARLADAEAGEQEDEQGWVRTETLCERMCMQPHLLPTWLHRARKQLTNTGLCQGDELIKDRGHRPRRELALKGCTVEIRRQDHP